MHELEGTSNVLVDERGTRGVPGHSGENALCLRGRLEVAGGCECGRRLIQAFRRLRVGERRERAAEAVEEPPSLFVAR